MADFKWTAYRLNRLSSAVRSYNAAITRRERELDAMGLSDMKQYLPERVTVDSVKARIYSVNDFRRIVGYRNDAKKGRPSELSRVLKSVNRDALEFTADDMTGSVTTNYAKREYRYNTIAIRKFRKKSMDDMQRPLFDGDTSVDFSDMSPAEISTITSDTDMVDDSEGEIDTSVEDVDADTLTKWRQEDARVKRSTVSPDGMYYTYMDAWKDPLNFHEEMPGYQTLINAMEWIAKNRTDVLNKMFNSGVDELTIFYIVESGGNTNPYVNIPYETRHARAVAYVTEKALKLGWKDTRNGIDRDA